MLKFPPPPSPPTESENYLEQLLEYYERLKEYYDKASKLATTQLTYVKALLNPDFELEQEKPTSTSLVDNNSQNATVSSHDVNFFDSKKSLSSNDDQWEEHPQNLPDEVAHPVLTLPTNSEGTEELLSDSIDEQWEEPPDSPELLNHDSGQAASLSTIELYYEPTTPITSQKNEQLEEEKDLDGQELVRASIEGSAEPQALSSLADLHLSEQIENLLEHHRGKVLQIDYIIRKLFGQIDEPILKERTVETSQLLQLGAEKGRWFEMPDSPHCWTIDLKEFPDLVEGEGKVEVKDRLSPTQKNLRPSQIPMREPYKQLSVFRAVEQVFRERPEEMLSADELVPILYGELPSKKSRIVRLNLNKVLSKGKLKGHWSKVPFKIGYYIAQKT